MTNSVLYMAAIGMALLFSCDSNIVIRFQKYSEGMLVAKTKSAESSNYVLCEFLLFTCSSVGGHGACFRCLTWETWRPRLRWTPQHSSQIKVPRFTDAQEGSGRKNDISVARTQGAAVLPDGRR